MNANKGEEFHTIMQNDSGYLQKHGGIDICFPLYFLHVFSFFYLIIKGDSLSECKINWFNLIQG